MSYTNILVIQTAFLGDVVLTTPLFRALKRLWPGARLTLMTTPQAKPLVEEDPHLEAILTYDKKGDESLFAAAAKLRGGGFDLLLSPHRSHRTALLARLSGIKTRVGYDQAGFSFLYNRKVKRPMELHEVDRNLALLAGVGEVALPEDRQLHAGFTREEQVLVERELQEGEVRADARLVGLCPGSVWATKRWTVEGFAAVGRALEKKGYRVVLVGGPDDRPVAEKVARAIGPGAVNAAGRTPLKALAAWVDRFALFVTNDSAPLHVAAARSVPTVAVFGATVRELGFYPFHLNSRLVEVELDCRPCGLHGHHKCPEGHFRCMGDVTPEMVLAACDELLTNETTDGTIEGAAR